MKTFEITVSGKTLSDIIYGIEEAKRRIERGNVAGVDANDDGDFEFSSAGNYEENDENEN